MTNGVKRSEESVSTDLLLLKRGNTELISALMDMVYQYGMPDKRGRVRDMALSANEGALALLEEAGFAKYMGKHGWKLDWNKLQKRRIKYME